MQKSAFIVSIITALWGLMLPAAAQERGTLEEAKALAIKAADHILHVGRETAFRDFHDKATTFFAKDLYVFVNDTECTFLAHGLNPKLVGRNIWKLKNPNGRFACRDIAMGLQKNPTIWTDYIFRDPYTNELAWKRTYSILIEDIIVNVGAYNPVQKEIQQ